MRRAVVAFLRYLHDLPADQQAYIAQFALEGDFKLHPDFYRTQIIGDFPERISVYDAFLEEKTHINRMCTLIGKPPLFKSDAGAYERPLGFGILIRPTKKEYRDFCLLLDQLLGDDINRQFFDGDIPLFEILTRADGGEKKQSIGTIALLENWFKARFRLSDPAKLNQTFKAIREVRKERQRPAHVADENDWNEKYIADQRNIMESAFSAIREIRMMLENHPKVANYDVPEWLRQGKVWFF